MGERPDEPVKVTSPAAALVSVSGADCAGARAVQRPVRLLEFHPLNAVSGQDRDLAAVEWRPGPSAPRRVELDLPALGGMLVPDPPGACDS